MKNSFMSIISSGKLFFFLIFHEAYVVNFLIKKVLFEIEWI